jgi:hypothetical protein
MPPCEGSLAWLLVDSEIAEFSIAVAFWDGDFSSAYLGNPLVGHRNGILQL